MEDLLASRVDDWIVVTGLQYADKPVIRVLPGARYKEGQWRLPLTWTHAKSLRYAFGTRLQLHGDLIAWAQQELDWRVAPSLGLKDSLKFDQSHEIHIFADQRIYEYQAVGAAFLTSGRDVLLADEPGSGKTVQVCAAFTNTEGPYLVISPNSVLRHWVRHVEDWTDLTPLLIKGSLAERRKRLATVDDKTVAIINWEGVRSHTRLAGYGSIALRRCAACGGDDSVAASRCEAHPKELNHIPWRVVVADEAHKLTDPKSKQTRAVWAVAHQSSVQYRWALTGTPLTNHLGTFWSLLHFIRPDEFSSKTQFLDHFCDVGYNAWGGLEVRGILPQREAEFKEVIAPLMRRMLKAQVLPQLPPKPPRSVRTVELTKHQLKMYKELDKTLVTRDAHGVRLSTSSDMVAATRLLQLTSATVELQGDHVRMVEPSPKLDELEALLEENDEQSIVIFSESRQLIELAAARLDKKIADTPGPMPWQWSYAKHVGLGTDFTEAERDRHLEDFQRGKKRLLLATMKAGSVGLNLTVANTVIFLQRSWSLVDNLQAEDRIHRPGAEQHSALQFIDIVAEGTIEEEQISAVHTKLEYLDQLTDDSKRLALLSQDLLDGNDG